MPTIALSPCRQMSDYLESVRRAGATPRELTLADEPAAIAAQVDGLMQPIERVYWPATKGTYDIPWFVHEIPTIVASTASPHLLPDIPQVKTYINCYDDKDVTLDALIDKLEGRSQFCGTPTTEVFGGLADTHC